ncbi:hypothetical protein OAT67_01750 [Bacteriovoracaceae bacterium]|nr:hypothetical protein [Bacteriovoracaceae bacterium]
MRSFLKSKVFNLVLIILLGLLFSCDQENSVRYFESLPHWNQIKVEDDHNFIPIAATFGLNGRVSPLITEVPFDRQKKSLNKLPPFIEYGGVKNLSGYIKILNKRFGDNKLLLDTGDIFSHKLPKAHRNKIEQFYDYQDYDVINFTETEILHYQKNDFKDSTLKNTTYLGSNIFEIKENKFLEREGIKPYFIKKINNIKVGVLGITEFSSTNSEIRKKIKGVYFQDPILAFMKNRNSLNRKGVDVIILMNHLKTMCKGKSHKVIRMGSDWENNQLKCPKNDPLKKFIDRLPPKSVHAIISTGPQHTSGFIGKIPILGGFPRGGNIGLMGLFIDKKNKEIIPSKTILFPLIKTCTLQFIGTWDCYIEKENHSIVNRREEFFQKTNYQMVSAKFLGHDVSAQTTKEALEAN